MKTVLAVLAGIAVASTASAAVDPQKTPKGDPRVRTAIYNPGQVLNAASTGLEPLRFVYDEGEVPKSISGLGVFFVHPDANGKEPDRSNWPSVRWEAVRSGNVVTLQPFGMMQPTVMFIRSTSADGQSRHYATVLSTRDGDVASGADPEAYFEIDYTYKHVPTPAEVAAWQARRDSQTSSWAERKARVLLSQAQQATTPTALMNADYWMKDPVGCPVLAPLRIFDNGHDTTLLFAPHAVLPIVSVANQDGKYADITPNPETTAEGVKVMLPATFSGLRLRRGEKVCGIENRGYDKVGTMLGSGSGTISPDVVRTVRTPR